MESKLKLTISTVKSELRTISTVKSELKLAISTVKPEPNLTVSTVRYELKDYTYSEV